MERPNSGIFGLLHLPTDLWAYVTDFLPGEQYALLKRTGSKHLWSRIQYPGVVKSVELGKHFFKLKSWPVLLNEFTTLSELVISSLHSDWLRNIGLKVHMIPSTLRKLGITGKVDAEQFFLNTEGNVLYFDEQVPNLQELDFPASGTSQSWLRCLPLTLTILSVYIWPAELPLPPLLIDLRVQFVYSGDELKLPIGLEKFYIPELWDLSLLVPPLKSFKTSSLGGLRVEKFPNLMANLPRTLTEIDAPSAVLPPQCWSYLPCTLLKLTLNNSISKWDILTRNFERKSPPTTEYPFHLLPKSITHLNYLESSPAIRGFINSAEPIFPPHLTLLGASNFFFMPNAVAALPPSLTHLELYNLCERVCKVLSNNLTTLIANHTVICSTLVSFLPPRLKSLELQCATAATTWFDYQSGEKFKLIEDMPEYAAHRSFKFDAGWSDQTLPPTLTSLKLVGFMGVRDSLAKQPLPRLHELSVLKCKSVTDTTIPYLGRHLATLILPYCLEITGKCFPSLPNYLVHLEIRHSASIFDSDIPYLPRSLKTIYFDSATHLTDACFQDLPLYLVTLVLRKNAVISKSCFQDLPFPVVNIRPSVLFEVAKWRIEYGILIDQPRW